MKKKEMRNERIEKRTDVEEDKENKEKQAINSNQTKMNKA